MSQYTRVEQVLRDTSKPLALHEVHEHIRLRFGVLDSEAAISARIREIRQALEASGGGSVHSEGVQGKAYLRYRVIATESDLQQAALFAD